jgi:hypothetical protein
MVIPGGVAEYYFSTNHLQLNHNAVKTSVQKKYFRHVADCVRSKPTNKLHMGNSTLFSGGD